MLTLQKLNPTDRIRFEEGIQARTISLILQQLKNNGVATAWKYLGNILGVNYTMISNYKNEQTRLSAMQLHKLIKSFPFLIELNLDSYMTGMETLYQMKSRAGKLGGKIGGQRILQLYPGKLQSQAQQAGRAFVNKYGIEFCRQKAKSISRLGGFAAIEKSEPTPQMRRLIIQNGELNLRLDKDFKINYTIRIGNQAHNVDFVYFKNNDISFIEEVTTAIPYDKIFFAKVLELVELKDWLYLNKLDVPIVFDFIMEKSDSTKTVKRVPLLALFSLIENNIIPIFDSNERKLIIKYLMNAKYPSAYMVKFKNFLNELFVKKLVKHRSVVIATKNKKMTESEKLVHEKLIDLNLTPLGKIIIENKYNLLMEVDNYFELNKEKWLVLITRTNSQAPEIITNHAKQHAGLCFIIKTMFNSYYKILSIILTDRELGNSKWVNYLYKHSDKVITKIDDLKSLKSI